MKTPDRSARSTIAPKKNRRQQTAAPSDAKRCGYQRDDQRRRRAAVQGGGSTNAARSPADSSDFGNAGCHDELWRNADAGRRCLLVFTKDAAFRRRRWRIITPVILAREAVFGVASLGCKISYHDFEKDPDRATHVKKADRNAKCEL